MILPGMPFGRPCALAKTPARTRKHCHVSPPPRRTWGSDNAHLSWCSFVPIPSRAALDLVLFTLHRYGWRLSGDLPAFARTLPSVSRPPALVTPQI